MKDKIEEAATYVGNDWKTGSYYDEAERVVETMWEHEVWPIIRKCDCDFSCVLDLAAGHGRNSNKLKDISSKIYIVDINQENIDFCKERFKNDKDRFVFIKNNGTDLNEISNGSISFVFCYDAMVHFDSDVVRAYLGEFRRILKPGGIGFCHHSNYTKNPEGDLHDNPGWRNYMSQSLFAHYCHKENLTVIESQILRSELDCITLFKIK